MDPILSEPSDDFFNLSSMQNHMKLDIATAIKLSGLAQNYSWGKVGKDSLVTKFMPTFKADTPYAELWFGCHPNGLSRIADHQDLTLKEVIKSDLSGTLGSQIAAKFSGNLPFLFKILSVGSALSIQTHPTLEQARQLHKAKPDLYKDENHKPEIAVAISTIKMFYGFRPYEELVANFAKISELRTLVGESAAGAFTNVKSSQDAESELKRLYGELMSKTLSNDGRMQLAEACGSLVSKCRSGEYSGEEAALILELAKSYPVDAGLFAPYLMNISEVKPGQAIFTEPCVPHAYLSGDMVEVMANSDNVVRAGLTPKPCDVSTLIEIVNCRMSQPKIISAESTSFGFKKYKTPAAEFEVQVLVEPFEGEITKPKSPELLFPINCKGSVTVSSKRTELANGEALFMSAAVGSYKLNIKSGQLFRVIVP